MFPLNYDVHMNTTPGMQAESSTGANQNDVPAISSPKFRGLKIFVYVLSILEGLIAGAIVTNISWSERWAAHMGPIGLLAGPFGGIVAAWFWIKIMMRHVNNHSSSIKIVIEGTIWGLFVGWLAAAILWFCERYLSPGNISLNFERVFSYAVHIGVFICGSIGGVAAGLGCSVLLALQTRERRRDSGNQTVAFPNPIPGLKGPTIFVYVVSILAGLFAGLITAMNFSQASGRILPVISLTLIMSVLVGVVAARFWIKRMTPFIRNRDSREKIVWRGIQCGLVAGWYASAIYWAILGVLLPLFVSFFAVVLIVLFGIGFFGSIGGLGAGVVCGVAWAIWTRPKNSSPSGGG
jgi:hypothetical protein